MTTMTAETSKLEISQVAQLTFGVIGRNLAAFSLMSLVLAGAPTLVIQWLILSSRTDAPSVGSAVAVGVLALAGAIVNMVFSLVLQAGLVTGAISDLNGRKLRLGEMIAGRAGFILPLLGLVILQTLALMLGFVLFVIPGLMMMVAWLVTVPAVVIDRSGVMGAFARSATLTRGNRWRLLGLLVIFGIAISVVSAMAQLLAGGMGAVTSATGGMRAGLVVVSVLQAVVIGVLGGVGVAVVYYELRRIKEGVAPQALIDTFS